MGSHRRTSPLLALMALCATASALRARRDRQSREVGAYTFTKFVEDFERTYTVGSAEYMRRFVIFEDSLAQISAKNARGGRLWTAGPHPFMDWTATERERLFGYSPSGGRRQELVALETRTNSSLLGGVGDSHVAATPPVINQGDLCGSCWAWASVQAVEAQLMKTDSPSRQKQYGSPVMLSTQAVLECAPNPHSCGGPGGCKGATGEIALDYIRDSGIPLEADLGYHPAHIEKCPLEPYPANTARVRIGGWRALPSNQAQPLMQALVEDGPVIVAADSRKWYDYLSGIFNDCPKDAVVNHAVLAKGYGDASGKKYWTIQNSWGTRWGEDGTMRLFRHDDEDGYCGTDHHPEEGFACDGSTTPVTVCGTCGLLFDPIIPQNPRIEAAQSPGSQDQTSWEPPTADEQADTAVSDAPAPVPAAELSNTENMKQLFGQQSSSNPSEDGRTRAQLEIHADISLPAPPPLDATVGSSTEQSAENTSASALPPLPSEPDVVSTDLSGAEFAAAGVPRLPAPSFPPSSVETAHDGASTLKKPADVDENTQLPASAVDDTTSPILKPGTFTEGMSRLLLGGQDSGRADAGTADGTLLSSF